MESHTPFFRPTCATIDLSALAENFKTVKKLVPRGVEIVAMVKADAYGHGAVPVSRKLVECGAFALGVATVEEGMELRNAGIKEQIIVMGGLMGMGSPASGMMVGADLTPVIHSADVIDFLETVAASAKKRMAVHLKVDTGMSRLGARPEALPKILERLSQCKWIYVEGVMTHLANAAEPEFTSKQTRVFLECKKLIEAKLGEIETWHIANSTAIMRGEPVVIPGAKRCLVRPGIALYGAMNDTPHPDPLPQGERVSLVPVMGLESKVALLKHIPAGTPVSYGCTFVAKRPTYIAIVPIGYADGYPLALSNNADVLIGGRRVPVVGRVTMDMIMVDVTDLPKVSVGDEVVLLGRQGSESISVEELAKKCDTISYEIFCGISKRMPRIYKE